MPETRHEGSCRVNQHRSRLWRLLLTIAILAVSHAVLAEGNCGNAIVDGGEECDDGGTCIGGSNAGTHCIKESDCHGNGVCIGGTKNRTACADDAACPGGLCRHCVPQGGDGCAANCTLESDAVYPLIPGRLETCGDGPNKGHSCSTDRDCANYPCTFGLSIGSGTSGVVLESDFLSIALPFGGACNDGDNAFQPCGTNADCSAGICVQSTENLTIGKERDGKIPVVVKGDSVKFPGIHYAACECIRGVVAQTCGGTFFDSDGVTPSLDCTLGFTSGNNICTAAGKPPCTFVHGKGNSASGEIGCTGLDNIDVVFSQDSGGASGVAGPPMIAFSGSGGPGSASALSSIEISAVLGGCTGSDLATYGPDGIYCTADDPPGGIIDIKATSPAVTGTALALVLNANGMDGRNLSLMSVTGSPFSCSALTQGSAAGGGLAQALTLLHLDTLGDMAVTGQFFANATVPPPPTPTPTPVSSCVGDCSGDSAVTIDEIITMVGIALDDCSPAGSCCASVDRWCSGPALTVNCIIEAVNNALESCPGPTPRDPSHADVPPVQNE